MDLLSDNSISISVAPGGPNRTFATAVPLGDFKRPALFLWRLAIGGPVAISTVFHLPDGSLLGPIDNDCQFVQRGPITAISTTGNTTVVPSQIYFSATPCMAITSDARRTVTIAAGATVPLPAGARTAWLLNAAPAAIQYVDSLGTVGPAVTPGSALPVPGRAESVSNPGASAVTVVFGF